MVDLTLLGLFIIGAVAGAGVVWVVLSRRVRDAESAAARSEQARLELQHALVTETERRSAAEATAARVRDLEAVVREREQQLHEAERVSAEARIELSRVQEQLTHEREATAEKLAVLENAKKSLEDSFKALSSNALNQNAQTFLELARAALEKHQERAKGELETKSREIDAVVKPLRESLEKVDQRINELERARAGAYHQLTEQVRQLHEVQQQLHAQTANLVQALRAPATRGRWGEIQLKRVVEMADMLKYCDFTEQESIATADGRLRPDMLVRLPNEKVIVVDAKVPLEAYLDAREAQDEETRNEHLRRHAQQIRAHVRKLGEKAYWEQFHAESPEFVVLFLPGEAFYSAALEADAQLIENAVQQRVLIATPMTLIALLKAVSFGWRQETIAREAHQISEAGSELYKRVRAFAEHFTGMRRGLERAVSSYNKAVGSLEHSVLPSARRLRSLGAGTGEEIGAVEMINHQTRQLNAPELVMPDDDEPPPNVPRVIQTEL
jgi:DNA recombination protein RmuC